MIRSNKGFTLVELMVVIVIMGVLAALAIPKFTDASVKAKASEAPTVLATFDNAVLASLAEQSGLPDAITDLVIEDPTAANFSKWFTYAATWADPVLLIATNPNAMGSVPANNTIQTSISGLSVVSHTNSAAFDKYVPNWSNVAN